MTSSKKPLTDQELTALCTAIEVRYDELFGRAKGAAYKKSKEDAWNDVKAECLAQGFRVFENKTVVQMRDDIYGYRKRSVEQKWRNSQKTGGGGVNWKEVRIMSIQDCIILRPNFMFKILIFSGKIPL